MSRVVAYSPSSLVLFDYFKENEKAEAEEETWDKKK